MRRTKTKNSLGPAASVLAALLILVSASRLTAEKKPKPDDNTGALEGIVFDPDGNPAVQAVVQLKDSRTLQVISFITKEDGKYHFANLKTDVEYQVKAEHNGLETGWKRLSIFDTRKVAEMNLKLDKKEPDKKEPEKGRPENEQPKQP
jgi:hypothetical protein